ncbi:hypothetical protein D3C85_659710 [compost metagenome]
MHVGRIAEQERPAIAKVIRHPVMHAVGREPVQLLDLHLHVLDGPAADVFEAQGLGVVGALVAYGADQARAATACQREHGKEVRLVEVHVQFTVECRATALYVGDVENLLVGTAGKPGIQGLAHNRPGAVAPGQEAGLTDFLLAVGQMQRGRDAVGGLLEAGQFGVAFHRDAEGLQALDQQPFVLVLRENFQERVGCQSLADLGQWQVRHGFTLDPEVGSRHPMAVLHNRVGQPELSIQFQRPRLDSQCPGRGAWGRGLVDNPHAHAQLAQPQRQDQAGRAGADDQHIASVHELILLAG